MASRAPGPSTSPFYDHEFAKQKMNRKGQIVPVSTRKIERWVCDRCGEKAEFPNELGETALEVGWLQIDLTRSLQAKPPVIREKNEQVLCPPCTDNLARWFTQHTSRGAVGS